MTYVIVAYDISDDRMRLMVSERLKALGLVRIQRSLFIGRGGFARAKDVFRAVSRYIDPSRDCLFITVVPTPNASRSIIYGRPMTDPTILSRGVVTV